MAIIKRKNDYLSSKKNSSLESTMKYKPWYKPNYQRILKSGKTLSF